MEIRGMILDIKYSATGFSVIKIREESSHKDMIIAGKIFDPKVDMKIIAEGEYQVHPKFGKQFTVTSCRMEVEKSRYAVINYLSSGLISGIGPVIAERIVDMFGVNVIEEIIEKDPSRLTDVPGISINKAKMIAKCHAENFVYQELAGLGLSISQIHKLFDQYGSNAVRIMKETPYRPIYDVDGFGFKIVDAIALKAGIAIDSADRIGAAITYSLINIGTQGHCWCHIDNLAAMIEDLLPDVPADKIAAQIIEEFTKRTIVREDDRVYAQKLYYAEKTTASNIAAMIKDTAAIISAGSMPVKEKQIARAIREVEAEFDITFDTMQKQAVFTSLNNRFSVITGGPGTGKSTITKAIITAWMKQYDKNEDPNDHIIVCAPTGRAAKRVSDITGVHGETVQSVIRKRNYECVDDDSPKLIILDEASMLDIYMSELITGLATEGHFLILIGDVDQLPPIGPGHFFRDCVLSGFVPTTRLALSFRQKGKIAINAKRINDGEGYHALCLDDPSFRFVYADKANVQQEVINQYIGLLNNGYAIEDICCIVPIRKSGRSQTAAEDLNWLLREKLNPPTSRGPDYKPEDWRVGDRVMNTENDHTNCVYNGDCGFITKIDKDTKTITVFMDDGRYIDFNQYRSSFLVLAYASTVHKSQGSEYKAVVIAQSQEHAFMLQRNLLYTAVTRARIELVIVGEPRAINLAVSKIPSLERNTSLRERIKEFMLKK